MSLDNVVTLTVEAVVAIHDEVLAESGGLPGICPDKSLESALHRVENHAFYSGVSELHEMAALYGVAIAQGHVFNDANKRRPSCRWQRSSTSTGSTWLLQ